MQDRASSPTPAGDLPSRLAAAWPAESWRDTGVAVAVSGGRDSVALLRALAEIKASCGGRGALEVLHFNHGLRGTASEADARWVAALADELSLPCHVGQAESLDSASEESLRDARREFYRSTADATGARYLATGHTADDQAETVLFRILRGSGLRGLRGIPRHACLTESCALVRPMLDETREDLRAYLEHLGQPHREDESNRDFTYTRNWVRGQALPVIQDRFPLAARQLVRLASQAEDVGRIVDHAAKQLLAAAALVPAAGKPVRLDRTRLAAEPPALVRETLRLAWREAGLPEQAMDTAGWHRLTTLALSERASERQSFPGGITASAADGALMLALGD